MDARRRHETPGLETKNRVVLPEEQQPECQLWFPLGPDSHRATHRGHMTPAQAEGCIAEEEPYLGKLALS